MLLAVWTGAAGAAVPNVTAVNPSTVPWGADPATITLTGTNLQDCGGGQVGSSALIATYAGQGTGWVMPTSSYSQTSVTGQLDPTVTKGPPVGGTVQVSVNASCTGTWQYSNQLAVTLGPAPFISSLGPSSATARGTDLTLTVNGSNFGSSPGATIQWNGSDRSTTYVSSGKLTTSIPAAEVCTSGSASVTVKLMGALSNQVAFTIDPAPAPTISGLDPSSVTLPAGSFSLAVSGASYMCGATVRWNGGALVTSWLSEGRLTAIVPASNVSTAGTATITVSQSSGTSAGQTFTIANPAPTLTGIDPASVAAGGSGFPITVNGSGFVSGSSVQWNGAARSTTLVSPTRLSATINSSDVQGPGTAMVTVFNPSPGGGLSNAATLSISSSEGPCAGVQCLAEGDCRWAGVCDSSTGECVEAHKPDGARCPGGTCSYGSCAPADEGVTESQSPARRSPEGLLGWGCGCGGPGPEAAIWWWALLGAWLLRLRRRGLTAAGSAQGVRRSSW